jgi:hypothetical protein
MGSSTWSDLCACWESYWTSCCCGQLCMTATHACHPTTKSDVGNTCDRAVLMSSTQVLPTPCRCSYLLLGELHAGQRKYEGISFQGPAMLS